MMRHQDYKHRPSRHATAVNGKNHRHRQERLFMNEISGWSAQLERGSEALLEANN